MRFIPSPFSLGLMALLLLSACADRPSGDDAVPAKTVIQSDEQNSGRSGGAGGEIITPRPQDAKRQQAIESCYLYADAQVRSSQQIDQDINQRNSTMGFGGSYRSFKDQMDPYAYKQQRQALYESCMNSQGYGGGQ